VIKKLSRLGNSSAFVVDRTMMQLMDIDADTPLRVTVEGRKLIIEPLSDAERAKKFNRVKAKVLRDNEEALRRLAK
jgi:antitoxin component of MazEF toxin-antitoxin module